MPFSIRPPTTHFFVTSFSFDQIHYSSDNLILLYGRVARSPPSDQLRSLTFAPGGLVPATSRYIRRVGRPRNEWATMIQKECFKMDARFSDRIYNEPGWKRAVHTYTSQPAA